MTNYFILPHILGLRVILFINLKKALISFKHYNLDYVFTQIIRLLHLLNLYHILLFFHYGRFLKLHPHLKLAFCQLYIIKYFIKLIINFL